MGTNVRLRLQIFYTYLYNYDRRTLLHFLLKLDFRFIGQTHVQQYIPVKTNHLVTNEKFFDISPSSFGVLCYTGIEH